MSDAPKAALPRGLDYLILHAGIFAGASAVVFIKLSHMHPILLSAGRLLVAALLLSPLFMREYRRHRAAHLFRLKDTLLPGLALAFHFIFWIQGARLAGSANGSLVVNLVPIAMPFFLYALFRERLTRMEWGGTAVAMAGLLLLGFSDFHLGREYLKGDALCFLSMLFLAGYMALARRNRHFPSLWLYVTPLYFCAGLFCLVLGLAVARPTTWPSGREWLLVFLLGLVPTIVGHSAINHAMKHLRGQSVSVLLMGQFIYAGILGYFFFAEIPAPFFYVASTLLVAGGWLSTRQVHDGSGAGALTERP